MENEAAKKLLLKYQQGNCTEAEKALLEQWYLQLNEDKNDIGMSPEKIESLLADVYSKLPGHHNAKAKALKLWTILGAIAAVMFIVLGVFTYRQNKDTASAPLYSNDIAPGINKAILTLANGKKISLSNTKTGIVISENKLTYNDGSTITGNNTGIQTISTPNGGQYQIMLPDGTKAWLNAASSLTYPTSFVSLKTRKVELSGEAYFEVAKDKNHPFIVQSGKQQVEVLGTHFNINSYADEQATTTTLLEGSVKVSIANTKASQILKPGQQASLSGDNLTVGKADLEEAMAWKNGYFRFNDESITSIMRKLSRWYNIEVQYQGDVPTGGLNGKVSRYKNISAVLKALESTQVVHFKITGRRITVMK